MTSFCPHCGQPAHVGAAFCPATGASLAAPPALPQPARAPAPAFVEPAIREYSVGEVMGLSLVTLGIFGMVRFYQAAQSYRRLAPGSAPNFEWQFWAYVGISCVTLIASILSACVGYVLIVPTVVIGALMLSEVCAAREQVLSSRGRRAELHSSLSHVGLWVVGQVLSIVLVGIVLLFVQGALFFQDHNAVARACDGSRE